MNKYLYLTIVAGGVIIADQVSKAMVMLHIPLYHSIAVIEGFFNLTHVHNPGGAFGFLADQSALVRSLLFICVSIIAIGIIFYFYRQTPRSHRWLALGLAAIFGGAIGNLIDRLRFGKVVDFLELYAGSFHWPAFNVADSAISIGLAIFIIHLLFNKLPDH